MSAVPKGKLPLPELAAMKKRGDRIVMVTAYDAPGARFAEDAGIDAILVGDTAAMVVLGYEGTTVPVTMDEMVFLARTVARAARRPIVIGDMPFGSYQVSDEDAVRNAIRFFKEARHGRGQARGRGPVALARARDRRRGHPGHGPHRADAAVGDDARRLQDAGEDGRARRGSSSTTRSRSRTRAASRWCSRRCPLRSRRRVTRRLEVPTIGIGAGRECDGQVLVYHDLLGLTEGHLPRFVKRYANLSREIRDALEALRARGARRRVPGGRAHVRDAGRRARPICREPPPRARAPDPLGRSRRRSRRRP